MYIVNASHSNVTANIYKKSDKNKKTNDFYYNCSEKSLESYTISINNFTSNYTYTCFTFQEII